MRATAQRLCLTALVALALGACEAVEQGQQVIQTVDRAAECARVVQEVTGLQVDSSTPEQIQQRVRELERAVREVRDVDVQRAGEQLVARAQELERAVREADPQAQARALQELTRAAEQVATTCGVSVEDVLGEQ